MSFETQVIHKLDKHGYTYNKLTGYMVSMNYELLKDKTLFVYGEV